MTEEQVATDLISLIEIAFEAGGPYCDASLLEEIEELVSPYDIVTSAAGDGITSAMNTLVLTTKRGAKFQIHVVRAK